MKTALGTFPALLLAGAMYVELAHAQIYLQPTPGFLFRSARERLQGHRPPPEEWCGHEGYYGSSWEERRREHRAREHCDRIPNPIERDQCLASFR